jgi:hypothetical protein
MNDYQRVFHFGWPYLRRYWHRLALGIVLGVVFGATNASFVGLTNLMATRLDPRASAQVESAAPGPAGGLQAATRGLSARVSAALDPWLPRHGRAPDRRPSWACAACAVTSAPTARAG